MNILIAMLFLFYVILFSECKVIPRSTTKAVKDVSFEKPRRVAREISEEDADSTTEDTQHSYEEAKRRITRHYSSVYPKTSEVIGSKTFYFPSVLDKRKKPTDFAALYAKHSLELVKKPIPKFNDIDEDDFQGNVMKIKLIDTDSPDIHEDEDFNVDDYDFDFNHDEFSGRLKPLQPRIRVGQLNEKYETPQTLPEINIITKPTVATVKPNNLTTETDLPHTQKESATAATLKTLKVEKFKEDEYYDPLFFKRSERDERDLLRNQDEDFNDSDDIRD